MKGLHTVARRAIVARLKNDAGLLALVAKPDMFGQSVLASHGWPFTKLGPSQTLPLRATGLDGATINIGLHAFAKPRYRNGDPRQAMLETAEDHAGRIGAAIERALDCCGETATVGDATARLTYKLADMQLMQDASEADAYHYSATVRVRAIAS